MKLIAENFTQEQYMLTQNILREIDYIKSSDGLKPLYNYKLANI